ncbi:sugar kinase [Kiritimatiellaeota bacterium B1221]|nr:sugar kinase [Kiritimatiellaeota bacterium B1221]
MANKIYTFGEIMGRFQPEGFARLKQSMPGPLNLTFGGAEGNVAASISMMGKETCFITALPQNDLGDACVATLKGLDVDTSAIVRTKGGRLGLYFIEAGANQRPSKVVYDRANSSISETPASAYGFSEVLKGAAWLHLSGITPALSEAAAHAVIEAAKAAKAHGVTVSCDLNFRKKLWDWKPGTDAKTLARETMSQVLPFVDVVIANEEDCSDVLNIQIEEQDIHSGSLQIDKYPEVAREVVKMFPNVSKVAITLRESLSASHNNWGAMFFDVAADKPYYAPLQDGEYQPYEIKNIVDRVGGGDSFAAGLIYALNDDELSTPGSAIAYAVAASCLAHSILGDVNYSTRDEVMNLMGGNASGRVQR